MQHSVFRGFGARCRSAGGEREAFFSRRRLRAFKDDNGENMVTRISSRKVTFKRPFLLGGFETTAPAGDYVIDTEEEQLDTATVSAWRRIATVIRVPVSGAIEHRTVDEDGLYQALMRDSAQDGVAVLATAAKKARNRARTKAPSRSVRRKRF